MSIKESWDSWLYFRKSCLILPRLSFQFLHVHKKHLITSNKKLWYCYNKTLLQKDVLNFCFQFYKYINVILSLSCSFFKVSTWITFKLTAKMHSFVHSVIHLLIIYIDIESLLQKKFTYRHMKIKKLEIDFMLKNIFDRKWM